MSSLPAVEASAVDKPAKAAKPAARKRAAAPKTTTRTRKTAPKPAPVEVAEAAEAADVVEAAEVVEVAEVVDVAEVAEVADPAPTPLPVVPVKTKRHNLRAIAGFGFLLAVGVAAAAVFLTGRGDEAPAQESSDPAAVSADELSSFAGSQDAPVYWAGPLQARTLELTSADAGTFVRYLPSGTDVGGSSRTLTVATYPLNNAYATAARRAKATGMTSSPTRNGGLAVWSKAQPTSVYVAFRGVPSLIEVYAPQAKEARTLALSGRLRPVR